MDFMTTPAPWLCRTNDQHAYCSKMRSREPGNHAGSAAWADDCLVEGGVTVKLLDMINADTTPHLVIHMHGIRSRNAALQMRSAHDAQ